MSAWSSLMPKRRDRGIKGPTAPLQNPPLWPCAQPRMLHSASRNLSEDEMILFKQTLLQNLKKNCLFSLSVSKRQQYKWKVFLSDIFNHQSMHTHTLWHCPVPAVSASRCANPEISLKGFMLDEEERGTRPRKKLWVGWNRRGLSHISSHWKPL